MGEGRELVIANVVAPNATPVAADSTELHIDPSITNLQIHYQVSAGTCTAFSAQAYGKDSDTMTYAPLGSAVTQADVAVGTSKIVTFAVPPKYFKVAVSGANTCTLKIAIYGT